MKPIKKPEGRVKTPIKLAIKPPFGGIKNPFRADMKVASAGFGMMKKGAGLFVKLRF